MRNMLVISGVSCWRLHISAAAVGLGMGIIFAHEALAFRKPDLAPLSDMDARMERLQARPKMHVQKAKALRHLNTMLPRARVGFDELLGSPRRIFVPEGFLSGPDGEGRGIGPAAAQVVPRTDPHRPIKAFVNEHPALFGFGAEELHRAKMARDYATPHNGLRTVVWEQQLDEIRVFESLFIGHITAKGELATISSQFVPDLEASAKAGTPNHDTLLAHPGVSARQAVTLAAKNLGLAIPEADLTTVGAGAAGKAKHEKFKGRSVRGEAEARLVWLPLNHASLRLCWEVVLTEAAHGQTYLLLVDVHDGTLWLRRFRSGTVPARGTAPLCRHAHNPHAEGLVRISAASAPTVFQKAAPACACPPVPVCNGFRPHPTEAEPAAPARPV
jgi:hypothetical protein